MAKKRPTPAGHTLSGQLRQIIASRGLTAYALGKDAGIAPAVIHRFLTGERELRTGTLDKIAAALGLRLVELARPKGRGHSSGQSSKG